MTRYKNSKAKNVPIFRINPPPPPHLKIWILPVHPLQNFHPACFEDYKNVSDLTVIKKNSTSFWPDQRLTCFCVFTVVIYWSYTLTEQGGHRTSIERLCQDRRSERRAFLCSQCRSKTGRTGDGAFGSENRGCFGGQCAISAKSGVTLLLINFHLLLAL